MFAVSLFNKFNQTTLYVAYSVFSDAYTRALDILAYDKTH